METRARLMFVDAGFPEPEVNAPVTNSAGAWSRTTDGGSRELWAEDLHRGPRRRWTLTSFAQALDLDPSTLRIA